MLGNLFDLKVENLIILAGYISKENEYERMLGTFFDLDEESNHLSGVCHTNLTKENQIISV